MTELKDTIDNGESEVQIATIGTVIGTGPNGEPVEQHLTEQSLMELADKHAGEEILVDADHESEMFGKTEAKGWLSGLKCIPGVGLFGKIRWTDIGRKLIENRVFRWLSPSWNLNKETKEPINMTSVALTNKPSQAGRIEPIVNSAPVELSETKPNMEELEMTITKEELVSLIKETVASMKSEQKTDTQEMQNAECACGKTDEMVDNACGKTDKMVDNACGKEADVTKNEEVIEDGIKEEIKEEIMEGKEEGKTKEEIKKEIKEEIAEEKMDDKEDDEVIKIEALNSAPTALKDVSGKADWMSLHGDAFWSYLAKHPEIKG